MDRTPVPSANESGRVRRQKRIGSDMKPLPRTLLSTLLLLAFTSGFAQQAKPVLSAAPTPPPAAPPTASPAAAPAASASSGLAADPSYVIGPEDSIKIIVWKEPNFSDSMAVRPDGMITLPLVGDVPAAGRTPAQLGDDLTGLLKKYVNEPTVTVSVLAVNSKHIYLVGEVGHIGPLAMTPGMNILQAIASAGGLSPYAHRNKIYIQRGEGAQQQMIKFSYDKALKKADMQGITLLPGDTIVVP
jgi:polysaccharide biosynthesis/export protein